MAKSLQLTAATLGSFFVIAFQLQLLPFFSPLFVDDRLFWPTIYYGTWSLVIGLTLVILATQRPVLHRSLPVLVVCAFAAGLTLSHPIDSISKNFLVATIFVACAAVLAIASAPLALLRFSASATVLTAVICLLDILFVHGFTNTAGRAAGLSINANVAAAGLFLGAAGSFWTVPHRLRSPFLLIVGTAIFVTLSRSTLIAAVMICFGIAADLLWTRIRSPRPHSRIRWLRSGALALALAGWIVVALFSNDRFSVAARSAFLQIGTAPTEFAEAREAIAGALSAKTPRSEDIIKEIARRAENEGDINSISARGLLMERAYLSYQTGPFFGQGLAAAHALQPHNTFLLFAIAFGDLGWIAPLAFLGLTVYSVRSIQQLPLFLATLAVMATSHDILFTPGLLAPVIFGIAGLNARRYHVDAPDAISAMRYAAVAAPIGFVIGATSAIGIGPSSIAAAPQLLLLFVFCAITLWSVGVWRWHKKLVLQRKEASPRGPAWD
ncbi:O-antigen ligase family protein [Bradyrhizobium sp. URHD0069]|uniref:O-antigen ligase family protein n=1 Tax=Bradyrhizobium sp. URHD0069 TaxID=1380355 RepID=UPI0004983AF2|nr:O-antigen ligase family protein [Bradyrhizobium sp. URHD0069]